MKEYIKSYHAFLPRKSVQWILYLIYPAGMLLLFFGGGMLVPRVVLMVMIPLVMISVECLIDMVQFGAIGNRENNRYMEYFKTSVKGRKIANRALIFDGVRRLLYVAGMAAVFIVTYYVEQESWMENMVWGCLCIGAATGFVVSLAVLVIRLIDNRMVQIAVLYLAVNLPLFLVMFSVQEWVVMQWKLPMLFLALAACYGIIAIGQVWFLTKKVKEGYYDR